MSSTDRTLRRLAPALVLALAMSGCASGGMGGSHATKEPDPPTPLDQHPVRLTEAPERLALGVHADGRLSAAQDAALADFAAGWREAVSPGSVVIEVPLNSASPGDPQRQADAAAARLEMMGVPHDQLSFGRYDAKGVAGAPVVARYEQVVAAAQGCDKGWDNLVATGSNKPSARFGCAVNKNLAAMLVDPHDIARPRAMTPADAGRRAAVLDKYRSGQITSSAKDEQAAGAVSRTVQ